MTKFVVDSAMDAHLLQIANYGNTMHVCALAPINHHEAVTPTAGQSGTSLMKKTLTLSAGAGTYTLADGTVSGRRVTVATQDTITVSATGNANHLAIVSDTRSALLLVTTVTSQAVTAGNQAIVNAFDLEVRDPT